MILKTPDQTDHDRDYGTHLKEDNIVLKDLVDEMGNPITIKKGYIIQAKIFYLITNHAGDNLANNNLDFTLTPMYTVLSNGIMRVCVGNQYYDGQVWVNVNGTWKEATDVFVNVDNMWKESV